MIIETNQIETLFLCDFHPAYQLKIFLIRNQTTTPFTSTWNQAIPISHGKNFIRSLIKTFQNFLTAMKNLIKLKGFIKKL